VRNWWRYQVHIPDSPFHFNDPATCPPFLLRQAQIHLRPLPRVPLVVSSRSPRQVSTGIERSMRHGEEPCASTSRRSRTPPST
jgi:hypothetical protein